MTQTDSTAKPPRKVAEYPTKKSARATFDYDGTTGRLIWRRDYSLAFRRRALAGTEVLKRDASGYVIVSQRGVGGFTLFAHRIIWIWHNGPIPAGMQVDHINGVRDDNRICNLRVVTRTVNLRNAKSKRGRSGHIGCFEQPNGKWMAIASLNGKKTYLGTFKHKKDAAKAPRSARMANGYTARHCAPSEVAS